jgi:hypothetical protein
MPSKVGYFSESKRHTWVPDRTKEGLQSQSWIMRYGVVLGAEIALGVHGILERHKIVVLQLSFVTAFDVLQYGSHKKSLTSTKKHHHEAPLERGLIYLFLFACWSC